MATAWVSKAAANGIPLGDNVTGTVDDDQLPYLTIEAAIAATSAGDTILLNGTVASPQAYDEDSNGMILTAGENRTFNTVVNDSRAAVINSVDPSRTVYLNGVVGTIFQRVTIDTANSNGSCVRTDSLGAATDTVFDGTHFIASSTYGLYMYAGFTLTGDWQITTSSPITNDAILFAPAVASTATIEGGTIDVSIDEGRGINATTSVAGCKLIVDGAVYDITHTGASTNPSFGILSEGVAEVEITNTDGTMTGTDRPIGILVNDSALVACTKLRIQNNTFDGTVLSPTGGYAFGTGDETATGTSRIDDVLITGNTGSHCDHGLWIGGYVTNVLGWGNTLDNCVLSLVTNLADDTTLLTGNLVTNPLNGGACLLHKGSTGSVLANNTVIVPDGRTTAIIESKAEGATNSTNPVVYNNDIQCLGSCELYVQVDASNTIDASNNNYNGTFDGTDFSYQGSVVDFATWASTYETDPKQNLASDALYGLGVEVTDAVAFSGTPFVVPFPIGAYFLNASAPTLTTPYSIDNPETYGSRSYFYQNRSRSSSNITSYNFSQEFSEPFSVGDIMWARLSDGWFTLRFISATNVEVL